MNKKAEYTKLSQEQESRVEVVRSSFSKMYDVIEHNCPNSRETEFAIMRLEEAQMWAIKSISRDK